MGDRNYKLKTRYSITESVYNDLLKGQEGSCKICGKEHTEEKKLHVDHHQHGEGHYVAGLLCGTCNSMIAHAKHNPDILMKGIHYLKQR